MNGLFLAVCSALGFLLFGLFGAEAFITSQTSDPLIARYGAEYLTICTVFSIGCCLQCMMEKVLVASGHSTYAMITQMVGALTNIVLDPVFIFGLFGVPRMEAAGRGHRHRHRPVCGARARPFCSTPSATMTSPCGCAASGRPAAPSAASTPSACPPSA